MVVPFAGAATRTVGPGSVPVVIQSRSGTENCGPHHDRFRRGRLGCSAGFAGDESRQRRLRQAAQIEVSRGHPLKFRRKCSGDCRSRECGRSGDFHRRAIRVRGRGQFSNSRASHRLAFRHRAQAQRLPGRRRRKGRVAEGKYRRVPLSVAAQATAIASFDIAM